MFQLSDLLSRSGSFRICASAESSSVLAMNLATPSCEAVLGSVSGSRYWEYMASGTQEILQPLLQDERPQLSSSFPSNDSRPFPVSLFVSNAQNLNARSISHDDVMQAVVRPLSLDERPGGCHVRAPQTLNPEP